MLTTTTSGTDCSVKLPGNSSQTEYWGESFNYDAWGKLTAKNTTMCTAENQSLAVDTIQNKNQLAGYTYDAAGNMIGNGSVSCSYDLDSQLSSCVGYHYGYDGDGNRIEKYSGSTGTIYWYGAGGVLTETDLSGNPQSDYIFFDGIRVGRRDLSAANNPVYYYFGNQINSASVVTDTNGTIKNEDDYYPWGGLLPYSSNAANHYLFTGKERDSETQLDYFGARYYGSAYGRFLTPDWSAKAEGVPYADFTDPQSLNLYGYVRDNPITRVDTDGHCDMSNGWCQVLSFIGCFCKPVQSLPLSPSAANAASQLADMVKPLAEKIAPVAAAVGLVPNARADQLEANKKQGKEFENAVKPQLESKQTGVVQQLTVKTESGVKTRVDFAGKNQSGQVVLTEAKSSETAPLTPNQTNAFPEIKETGATVVGQGKPGFPGGTKIPPTEVEIVRPPIIPE